MTWRFGQNPGRHVKQTGFSKFIREASSEEKKRVYAEVLQKAAESQLRVIEEARQERDRRRTS